MNITDQARLQPLAPPAPEADRPHPKVSRWAYVLIVIGVLSVFDLVGLDNWGTPLVMIVVGVALVTRPYSWGRPLTTGLVIAALLAVGGWYTVQPAVTGTSTTETLNVPLTAVRAEIELSPSVGRLEVGLGSGGALIEGRLELNRNERLERRTLTRGDTQVVQLSTRQSGPSISLFGHLGQDSARWLVTLSPAVPLVLEVNAGVGESALDLTGLNVTDLRFGGGVGRATVRLPATGIVSAVIESGVGELKVTVPSGMKARVQVDPGLGAVKVVGDFLRDGDTSISRGYAQSPNRVDLRIQGGVGEVYVEQR